ncbi:MAG: pilus assembly protein TadG-related protein [Terriglobia bacterium]
MSRTFPSIVHRILNDERGQTLPMMALVFMGILGLAGLVIDSCHLYYCYNELQASADAAALAGAASLPNTTATTVANQYSAVGTGLNAQSDLPNVTMASGYPLLKCLSTLTNESIPCVAPANANAIQVKEQASVPLFFGGILGFASVTIGASATAAMRGATTGPYNVAIVIDTTQSMTDTDRDSDCDASRVKCAFAGMLTLLSDLSPCATSESTCGTPTSGNVSNSLDTVSLLVFPGFTNSSQGQYDYDCSNSPAPAIAEYSSSTVYTVVPFASDYRGSDTATSLNASSDLVLAAYGSSSCPEGVDVKGGEGTFYAGIITSAQALLETEQASRPNSQNVMILLSDGDATASDSRRSQQIDLSDYPDTQECHQAVTAAQAATADGTRVYAVAYGAESSGCTTDTDPTITPCQTMEDIASSPLYFFSDYTATGGDSSCVSASRPTTSLDEIFTEIAGDLTVARLIPDNET